MIIGWSVVPFAELLAQLAGWPAGTRPAVVGVNGHSSSGKTSLAAPAGGRAARRRVLHTDDLAWHQGVFTWDALLLDDVLPVVRSGAPLDYRPPQWSPADGPTRSCCGRSLSGWWWRGSGPARPPSATSSTLVIWVETEEPTRFGRDVVRVEQNGEMSVADFRSWMAEENAYVVAERPWEHADLVVYGGLTVEHDPDTEVVLGVVTPP